MNGSGFLWCWIGKQTETYTTIQSKIYIFFLLEYQINVRSIQRSVIIEKREMEKRKEATRGASSGTDRQTESTFGGELLMLICLTTLFARLQIHQPASQPSSTLVQINRTQLQVHQPINQIQFLLPSPANIRPSVRSWFSRLIYISVVSERVSSNILLSSSSSSSLHLHVQYQSNPAQQLAGINQSFWPEICF